MCICSVAGVWKVNPCALHYICACLCVCVFVCGQVLCSVCTVASFLLVGRCMTEPSSVSPCDPVINANLWRCLSHTLLSAPQRCKVCVTIESYCNQAHPLTQWINQLVIHFLIPPHSLICSCTYHITMCKVSLTIQHFALPADLINMTDAHLLIHALSEWVSVHCSLVGSLMGELSHSLSLSHDTSQAVAVGVKVWFTYEWSYC